jgi:hypothetical protein
MSRDLKAHISECDRWDYDRKTAEHCMERTGNAGEEYKTEICHESTIRTAMATHANAT